jgi:hypothetical protein
VLHHVDSVRNRDERIENQVVLSPREPLRPGALTVDPRPHHDRSLLGTPRAAGALPEGQTEGGRADGGRQDGSEVGLCAGQEELDAEARDCTRRRAAVPPRCRLAAARRPLACTRQTAAATTHTESPTLATCTCTRLAAARAPAPLLMPLQNAATAAVPASALATWRGASNSGNAAAPV